MYSVSNWSGNSSAYPQHRWMPENTGQLVGLVQRIHAQRERMRVIGAGHSFSSVALTDDNLISLDRLSGIVSVDRETKRVRFAAGTRLRDIPQLLQPYGLALPNMGDVDPQSVAGALSTSTHGTGLGFTGFAGCTTGLTLLTARGEVLEVSRESDPELFDMARVSLGVLGILLEVELACVDAFDLIAQESAVGFDELVDTFVDRSRESDHAEFFWFPHTSRAVLKTNTRVAPDAPGPTGLEEVARRGKLERWFSEEVVDNGGLLAMSEIGTLLPSAIPFLNQVAGAATSNRAYRAPSHEVFVSPRRVKFNEMEYALPLEEGPEALREIKAFLDSRPDTVSFPLEVRTSAADDAALSTSTGRESMYIAAHRYVKKDYAEYFARLEQILVRHGGRPHWGKIHTLRRAQLSRLYPRFEEFCALREEMDPYGTLLNRHTERLFVEP